MISETRKTREFYEFQIVVAISVVIATIVMILILNSYTPFTGHYPCEFVRGARL